MTVPLASSIPIMFYSVDANQFVFAAGFGYDRYGPPPGLEFMRGDARIRAVRASLRVMDSCGSRKDSLMQYLLNIAQYPRQEKPRAPMLVDAPDDEAILTRASEVLQQVRNAGAEKVQVQIRRAANLVLVGHVGDEA
jgi:hypothetical protein